MTGNLAVFFLLTGLLSVNALADTNSPCPVTIGFDRLLGPPFPDSETWYGSESLAVSLPPDGNWGVTGPGARIAVKLFVWSIEFEPGMEANLSVETASLTGQPNDAVVKGVTNAKLGDDGSWAMLAGIHFPSTGCWRIDLEYLGQSLSFVVRTVPLSDNN